MAQCIKSHREATVPQTGCDSLEERRVYYQLGSYRCQNTLYNGTHFRSVSRLVAQLLRRSVAHFAIQRAQHEEGCERLRVNTARRAQPPETAIPTHPNCRLALALHPFVRPRPARSPPFPLPGRRHPRRPRRCRLFVTIGQKFHCNRYATHRHHCLCPLLSPND